MITKQMKQDMLKEIIQWIEGLIGFAFYMWFSGINWVEFWEDARHFLAALGTALAVGAFSKLGNLLMEVIIRIYRNKKNKKQ